MADTSQMSQLLEHLRLSLEQQVAALGERRRQLQASMEADVETASRQVASQQEVLENLRYEAEMLTEKLMKLRANRQDVEAELFQLKDKRIRLLEVINKLEDEEMQLVSEVNKIIHFKKSLLKEVPYFEARAKASASLAVVQDYLLASIDHLQTQQHDRAAGAAAAVATAAAATWQGTANVRRPAANWIVMPTTPAGSSMPPTPGSGTSTMPPTPGTAPDSTAATSTTADEAHRPSSSGTAAAPVGAATAAAPVGAATAAATAAASTSNDVVSGTAEAVQRLQLSAGASTGQAEQQQQQQQQQQQDGGPFAAVTVEQLMQMQPQEAAPLEGLPTLPEGKPFPSPDTLDTPLSSGDPALGGLARAGALQSFASGARSSGSFAPVGTIGARGGKDATSSTSGFTSSTLTSSRGSGLAHNGSESVRSTGSLAAGGLLGSGSFTSPATPFGNIQSTEESPRGGDTRSSSGGIAAAAAAVSSTGAPPTAPAAGGSGQHQQGLVLQPQPFNQQQQQQQLPWIASRSPSQLGLVSHIQPPPPPPPPPPRRTASQNLGQATMQQQSPMVQQQALPVQQQSPMVQQQSPLAAAVAAGTSLAQQQQQQQQMSMPAAPPLSPRVQQLQLPQVLLQAPPGIFLQQEGAQVPHSPHRLLLLQPQTLAEHSMQLQFQLAQVQQAQQQQQQQAQQQEAQQQQVHQQQQQQQQEAQRQAAQQQQQQQQQVMLLADHLRLPVTVGQLPQTSFDLTGGSSIDLSAAFASNALPSIASAIPLRLAPVQPASREMWVLPAGAVVLQADTTDSRQRLSGMMSLQSLQGLAAASGPASTGTAGGTAAVPLPGTSLSPIAAAAAAPVVVLASPDTANQGGLFQLQQQVQQLQQQLHGQQQLHQSGDLGSSIFETQQ